MDRITYTPNGVCANYILIDIEDDIIKDVTFVGGCQGNSKGISELVKEMPVSNVIEKLSYIKCGNKNTSCPDQLAKALVDYMEIKNEDN